MKTTRHLPHLVSSLVALASLSLLAPRESLACSAGLTCLGGMMTPATGSEVPASTPGIVWIPLRGAGAAPSASDVALFEVTTAGENPVAADVQPFGTVGAFVVIPATPLQPNADYVVRGKNLCVDTDPPTESKFHTNDAAPLPTTLGTILSTSSFSKLEVATTSGACSDMIDATRADVSLTLSPEALPFEDALFYETLVDGQPWRPTNSLNQELPFGKSWVGRGKDLLYARCNAPMPGDIGDGLPEGNHTVVFRASLPGSNIVLQSDPLDVSLKCQPIDSVNDPNDPPRIDPGDGSGGCSVAPGGFGKANGFFVAIPALLFALALRRRRASRP